MIAAGGLASNRNVMVQVVGEFKEKQAYSQGFIQSIVKMQLAVAMENQESRVSIQIRKIDLGKMGKLTKILKYVIIVKKDSRKARYEELSTQI